MSRKRSGCLGCSKYLIIILIIILIASFIINGGLGDFSDKTVVSNKNNTVTPVAETFCFYYDQLNSTEKHIYDSLLAELKKGGLSCTINNIDYNTYAGAVNRACIALKYDHPEFFWINSGSSYSGQYGFGENSDTINILLTCYQYWQYTNDPQKYTDKLEAKVEEIAKKADRQATEIEKVKYVHDYIVSNTIYDHDALAEARKTFHNASSEYIYSAYGCLVDQKAVCAGYAFAFQMIMHELGIPCTYIVGDAGGSHAWNLITLDGKNYYIDATWDDGDYLDDHGNNKYDGNAEYDYFCITTNELTKTHTISEEYFDIPTCTATEYNYFEYYDYKLDYYSFNELVNIINKQSNLDIICIQFASKQELQKASKDLFDNYNWQNIPLLTQSKISYSVDEDHLILTFFRE